MARVLAEAVRLATEKARKLATDAFESDFKASQRFNTISFGADGKIEADKTDAQGKFTIDWLNAYNAPHWMQFFAGTGNTAATAAKFSEE